MIPLLLQNVVFQIITVNSTTPCFYNYTAGAEMLRQCGYTTDWLQAIILPFQWVSGGWFSMMLVGVLCLITYMKYQKVLYPILIGVFWLPFSAALFPAEFLNFAFLMASVGIGYVIAYIILKATKEY